jgi:hypothetical protein
MEPDRARLLRLVWRHMPAGPLEHHDRLLFPAHIFCGARLVRMPNGSDRRVVVRHSWREGNEPFRTTPVRALRKSGNPLRKGDIY